MIGLHRRWIWPLLCTQELSGTPCTSRSSQPTFRELLCSSTPTALDGSLHCCHEVVQQLLSTVDIINLGQRRDKAIAEVLLCVAGPCLGDGSLVNILNSLLGQAWEAAKIVKIHTCSRWCCCTGAVSGQHELQRVLEHSACLTLPAVDCLMARAVCRRPMLNVTVYLLAGHRAGQPRHTAD